MTRHREGFVPLISRRDLLKHGTVGVGVLALAGCGQKKAPELTCTDTSGLTPPEQAMRTSLAYVDRSPHADKRCDNCEFYVPQTSPNQCGGCKLLKGPIHPKGYCNSWVAKKT